MTLSEISSLAHIAERRSALSTIICAVQPVRISSVFLLFNYKLIHVHSMLASPGVVELPIWLLAHHLSCHFFYCPNLA